MADKRKVLLVGESWVSAATHYKGFDQFGSVSFSTGAEPLLNALAGAMFEITYLPGHEVPTGLPFTREELARYDAIILSDIGANSVLLPPDVFLNGQPRPNRLKLIREWTRDGGGLVMAGGYLSFQGIDGRGRWARTPVEEALPVTMLRFDDRLEIPDGFRPQIIGSETHPILKDLSGEWPLLLGANEVSVKQNFGAEQLVRLPDEEGGHPLLVVAPFGAGRSVAWTSDIGPHWVPPVFIDWPGYAMLWRNILSWATQLI